jgi:hypothetical protein
MIYCHAKVQGHVLDENPAVPTSKFAAQSRYVGVMSDMVLTITTAWMVCNDMTQLPNITTARHVKNHWEAMCARSTQGH